MGLLGHSERLDCYLLGPEVHHLDDLSKSVVDLV
jgi:hypothetical protein